LGRKEAEGRSRREQSLEEKSPRRVRRKSEKAAWTEEPENKGSQVPPEISAIKARCSDGWFHPEDTIKLARYHLAAIKPESTVKDSRTSKGLKKDAKKKRSINSSASGSSEGKKKPDARVLSEWEHLSDTFVSDTKPTAEERQAHRELLYNGGSTRTTPTT
jgi:hypothetical protein